MTIDHQIRDEKLQYNINKETAKISVLLSGKLYKYEYLTGEDILPSTQQQIIEEPRFTYSPLGKAFQKQTKTIEDQGEKQIKAIEDHEKRLVKSNTLTEKYSLPFDKQKIYCISLWQKEWKQWENCTIVLILKNCYIITRVPLQM